VKVYNIANYKKPDTKRKFTPQDFNDIKGIISSRLKECNIILKNNVKNKSMDNVQDVINDISIYTLALIGLKSLEEKNDIRK
jgi:uncharacterized protein (DUF2225 family)